MMASETLGEMCDRLNAQIDEMRQEREQWHEHWLAAKAKRPRQPTLGEMMGVLRRSQTSGG